MVKMYNYPKSIFIRKIAKKIKEPEEICKKIIDLDFKNLMSDPKIKEKK